MEDSGISLSPSYRQLNNELRYEINRLETFNTWPIESPIESARIAKAGFFYTGTGYEVQCFACSGKITSWNYGDQAISKHRTMNPSCPFILNRSSNVPLHSQSEQISGSSPSNVNSSLTALAPANSSASHQTPLHDSVQSEQHIEQNESGGDVLMNMNLPSNINSIPPESASTSITTVDGINFSRPSLADVAMASSSTERVNRMAVSSNVANQSSRSFLSHHDWAILKREDVRLRTFDERFTATFLSPLVLAQTGFFYLGVADVVQCAFCRGVVKDWEINDDPRQEHRRLFPSCAFILGLPVGNFPVGEELAYHSALGRTASLANNTGGNGMEITQRFPSQARPNASPDTEIGSSNNMQLNALIGDNLEQLGILEHCLEHRGPRYSNYSTFESRIKSFKNWSSHLKQTPSIMAQAGFFYLGTSDHVSCFSCGSGLRNWEPEDDPWMEHARWFPQCRFLILMKGEQYIKEASESIPTSNFGASRSKSKAPPLLLMGSSRPSPSREVSEAELERTLLDSPIAQTVLAMGVDLSRVKQAFQFKLRTTGTSFTTVDSLLEAAIEAQHSSEHRQALEDRNYETVEWPAALSTRQQGTETLLNDASNAFVLHEERRDIDTNIHCQTESEDLHIERPLELLSTAEENSINNEIKTTENDRTQILEEEIRKLKEARLCKVCLDEDMAIAFVPCGHLVTCFSCAAALDNCPLCRKKIKGTVRIFFS